MHKHLILNLAALATLLAVTAASRADVNIRVPFVRVHVGPGAVVVSPPVVGPIVVERPAPLPIIIGQPVDVPPVVLIQPRIIVNRVPTLDEFAASFKPAPGKYEVVILHPVTCEPVKVCFCLPEGCPKKVKVHNREIDFDYGRSEVSIRFIRDGRVRVTD